MLVAFSSTPFTIRYETLLLLLCNHPLFNLVLFVDVRLLLRV
jgi:hypothetical protein